MEKITANECYGCMLCVNQCPVQAICISYDECGFPYPVIKAQQCVNCQKCVKTCIANSAPQRCEEMQSAYSTSVKDASVLLKSASGGIAYALSKTFIDNGGVVYGVAYTKDYRSAEYVRIDTVDGSSRLQDTKYFHASADSKSSLYPRIAEDRKQKRQVLVTGLPCEIAAVKKLFDDEGVFLAELYCHGVTSEDVHKKYICKISRQQGLKYFSVKNKSEGWKQNALIRAETTDGSVHEEHFYSSSYGYAFAHLSRKSCYSCQFKGNGRVADISMGDNWAVVSSGKSYQKNGVSVIQIHTEKGNELFRQCLPLVDFSEISYEASTTENKWVNRSIPLGDRDIYAKKFAVSTDIYLPAKLKIKGMIKSVLKKG